MAKTKEKPPRRLTASVFITPEGGVGGEFPTPIPFGLEYSREFVKNYTAACQRIGQKTRIVWGGTAL